MATTAKRAASRRDLAVKALAAKALADAEQQRRSRISREYWDAPDLSARFGIHRVTLWRWVKLKVFPPPIYLTPTKPVWPDVVVRAWCAEREASA